jgi:hypothetical protein
METFTHAQSQKAPEIPPQIAKMEQERKEALTVVLAQIEHIVQEEGVPRSVEIYGREYPLRNNSESDLLVAKTQQYIKASKKVLENVRGRDYRQEQAAAKLVDLLEENRLVTEKYAEFLEHFPALASSIKHMMPSLSTENSINKTGDDKYLVH